MKRIIKIILSLFMVLSIAACSSGKNTNLSVDDSFYSDLKQGLIDRWKLTDQQDDYDTEDFNNYIDCELKQIKKYKNSKFKNKEIQQYATEYINILEKSRKYTKYIDSNEDKWESLYTNDLYLRRCAVLVNLNKIKTIKFDSKSENKNFKGLLESGNMCISIQKIIENTNFEKEPNEYDDDEDSWNTYSAVVENSSNSDFSYFQYNISLEDENGVVVETTIANTENWKAGQKHKFEFSTDSKFDKWVINNAEYNY